MLLTTLISRLLTFEFLRLNLTAANRVFLVEPQWNPSVENQAIARAIRLRQRDKVLVTRYIINETVEEVSARKPYTCTYQCTCTCA